MIFWTSGGAREFELETPNLLWLVLRLSSISAPIFTTFPQSVLWAAIDAMAEEEVVVVEEGLFTSIFNESLATSVVPTSFKKSIIIPVPKNNKPSCLNDYRPVAITSIVMKVFERLVKSHICSSIPVTLDPLQFANRPNRSTDDAISHILHSSLTHIDSSNGKFERLLFIDYSSAFDTIVPIKLASKLTDLCLNSFWIQDFLTGIPQVVKIGQFTSNSITLNVGAPQGCVLSPLLYSIYTHDCVSSHYDVRHCNMLWPPPCLPG